MARTTVNPSNIGLQSCAVYEGRATLEPSNRSRVGRPVRTVLAPRRPQVRERKVIDGLHTLTDPSLSFYDGFSLHCQPSKRAGGKGSETSDAGSLADWLIFCVEFFALIFSAR